MVVGNIPASPPVGKTLYPCMYIYIYIYIGSICRQQLFRSLTAHQYSSDQMKILKDQSAQTSARVMRVAYYIYIYYIYKTIIYIIYILYIYMYIQLNIRKETKGWRYSEFHVAHATIFSLLIIILYRNGTIQKAITYYMTSFCVLRDVRFTSSKLFRWRHWGITSDLLFIKFFLDRL